MGQQTSQLFNSIAPNMGVGYIYCSRALGAIYCNRLIDGQALVAIYCNRLIDGQALVAIYYLRLIGCHLVNFLISLSLLPDYKKVVVRLGASGMTAKNERINLGKPAGKDDGLFSGSC
jgi:uncharacterized membrane protein